MQFNYTVRVDEYMEGPVSDEWTKSDDEPSPIEEPEAEVTPEPGNESPADEDSAPVEEPEDNTPLKEPESETKPGKDEEIDKKADNSDEENSSDDHADPLDAAIITLISILISVLFGGAGGPVPGTTDEAVKPPAPSSDNDLGKWIRFDDEGDLEATDPITGEKRSFVHNGDGTYTDPVSGATYTPEELSQQMNHREENAKTIQKDQEQFNKNVAEDSRRNEERSEDSKKFEEDLRRRERNGLTEKRLSE